MIRPVYTLHATVKRPRRGFFQVLRDLLDRVTFGRQEPVNSFSVSGIPELSEAGREWVRGRCAYFRTGKLIYFMGRIDNISRSESGDQRIKLAAPLPIAPADGDELEIF